MEVLVQLVLYLEQRLLFHAGPDNSRNLAQLCSICIVRGGRSGDRKYRRPLLEGTQWRPVFNNALQWWGVDCKCQCMGVCACVNDRVQNVIQRVLMYRHVLAALG